MFDIINSTHTIHFCILLIKNMLGGKCMCIPSYYKNEVAILKNAFPPSNHAGLRVFSISEILTDIDPYVFFYFVLYILFQYNICNIFVYYYSF